ncbi:hypothetical protein EDB84DRAFT_1565702 [Lactarius hengduanensis]|nr:hypothetical protein EDB84DRAFT_1565702 [Lactarius hengduanensis]
MARNTPPPPSRCAAPTRHARPSAQCHSCTRATFIRPCPDPATANPPRRPNTARKTFGRMNMISHSCTRATSIPAPTPRHRQPTAPPQHGTQDLDRQPTTTPPQHGTQRHATADPHATPTRAQHPAIRRLTARRPNTARQDPATSRKTLPTRHCPFNAARKAPATTDLHATPPHADSPPRQDPRHRRPATSPQRGAQHPTDRHASSTLARKAPAIPPTPTPPRHDAQHANSPPRQDPASADPPRRPHAARNTPPTCHDPDPIRASILPPYSSTNSMYLF